MKEYLQILKSRVPKEKIPEFLFVLSVVIISFFSANHFNIGFSVSLSVILLILFSILFIATWFMAGIAVFKSVIIASVSLSVVIFLVQTYCELPLTSHTANNELKNLLMFALAYSVYLFIISLYKELFGDKKEQKGTFKLLDEMYGGKKPWLIVTLYAMFIGLFIWQLYQVMKPIFSSFCVSIFN